MKNKSIRLLSIAFGVALVSYLAAISFASDFESLIQSYSASVTASGMDTVSGVGTVLKTSPIAAQTQVVFKVQNPDLTSYELNAVSSTIGVASVELPAFRTRQAGIYKVSAKELGAPVFGTESTFKVLPGQISESLSEVTPLDQVIKIGREVGQIEVTLKDVFGNPVDSHMLQLISSRDSDTVTTNSNLTGTNGTVVFNVNSNQAGVSTYTVYDLSKNKAISSRAKVVYFNSSNDLFQNGSDSMDVSDYGQASLLSYSQNAYVGQKVAYGPAVGASAGPVAYLGFKDLPQNVSTGQSVSFTLAALDATQQVVTDYSGTVHFSVVSGSATSVKLPSDYTFGVADAGSHTFSLALSFNTAGTYVIQAADSVDLKIYGTLTITVSSSGGGNTDLIKVTNPVAGSFSNNVQAISGTAKPGSKLKIFDNNVEIGSATADPTGSFMFVTTPLADGTHSIYVAIVNDAGVITASSSKIDLKIDTTPPKLEKIEFVPAGVAAGAQVEARVYSESGLQQVLLVVGENSYEMKDSGLGYYSSTFKAPALASDYPSTVTLVDVLENKTKLDKQTSLKVGVGGTPGLGTLPGGGTLGTAGIEIPGAVSGLVAYPTDHRVTLTWKAPMNGSPVKFYRVFYGLAPTQLKYVVDTWDAKTTWYIPDLKNGTQYYFAVAAISNSGNAGTLLSNIVTGIPGSSSYLPPDVLNGTAGQNQLKDMKTDVSKTGPEVVWIFALAIFASLLYSHFSKKKSVQ